MSTTAGEKRMTVLQATFIGVGSMVGAGIFALLGAAGAVAGSAVWVSFLVAGAIAGLQGHRPHGHDGHLPGLLRDHTGRGAPPVLTPPEGRAR